MNLEDYEFTDAIQKRATFGKLVLNIPVDEVLEQIDHAEALGPLLDPGKCNGEWMDSANDWGKLARAFRDFRDAAKPLLTKGG